MSNKEIMKSKKDDQLSAMAARVRRFNAFIQEVEYLWERPLVRRLVYFASAITAWWLGAPASLVRRVVLGG